MRGNDVMRHVGVLLVAIVGVVHLQQYVSFIKDVPTVGTLFLLNGAGAGAVIVMLAIRRLRMLVVIAAIGLCLGSVVSIAISSSSSAGFFGYTEPTLRGPVVVAVFAEVLAIITFALLALSPRSDPA